MENIVVSTIGFTKTTAENFFERLVKNRVKRIIDVRLNNTSQLAGFAKASDLTYFLKKIGSIQYIHQPMLAPTKDMLSAYKNQKGDWGVYEGKFIELMKQRQIENKLNPSVFDGACLLCSENTAHHCHRRLVCEYLNRHWKGSLSVNHL